MAKITENTIEEFAIELLEKLGYNYIYAPDIAPDSDNPQRASFEEVLLPKILQSAISRINPTIPIPAKEDAFKQVERIHSPELLVNNEEFHRFLTDGVKVSYQHEGNDRGEIVWLIDFDNPEHNEFSVVNQFTVMRQRQAPCRLVLLDLWHGNLLMGSQKCHHRFKTDPSGRYLLTHPY